jgi:integration host factor subunit alpha
MTITKAQISETIQNDLGYSKNQSVELVEQLLEILKSNLANGDDVLISGFGKFCVQDKKARRGRNPATGEEKIISARKIVAFKCSGKLRERINKCSVD